MGLHFEMISGEFFTFNLLIIPYKKSFVSLSRLTNFTTEASNMNPDRIASKGVARSWHMLFAV